MAGKQTTIKVLMTCFNRKQHTLHCLESLYRQQGLNEKFELDIFLVDDGSTDGTGEAVSEFFPGVQLVAGTGDLFWNRGMNLAWNTAAAAGAADFFMWLNDDTFLYDDAVANLMEVAVEQPGAIVAGYTNSAVNGAATYGGFRLSNNQLVHPTGKVQAVDYFNGNCVLIPFAVFQQVKFLDPHFHHALGDFDYGLRARKKNIKIWMTARPVGTCEAHPALPKWFNPTNSIGERFKALYRSSSSCNPTQYFRFEQRHYGWGKAIFHYLTIHLRSAWPALWK